MKSQQVLVLSEKHGSFALGSRLIPAPGPGELLVKVHATALNPADWKVQQYGYLVPEENYPAILGLDISGEVVRPGNGIAGFAQGDRVLAQGSNWTNDEGSFQQYAITTANTTAKIPANVTYEQAATLPVALACAYLGLYNSRPNGLGLASPFIPGQRDRNKDQPIVILGGSSSVGQYAIQLAKLSGFSPIISTSSPTHTDYLKSLGSTHVLNRTLPWPEIQAEITTILAGSQLEYVYDAISSPETQQLGHDILVAVSGGGSLVITSPPTINDKRDEVAIVHVLADSKRPENQNALLEMYQHLEGVLEEGVLVSNRYELLEGGLAAIPEGLQRMKDGQVSGVKLVVRPWG